MKYASIFKSATAVYTKRGAELFQRYRERALLWEVSKKGETEREEGKIKLVREGYKL